MNDIPTIVFCVIATIATVVVFGSNFYYMYKIKKLDEKGDS